MHRPDLEPPSLAAAFTAPLARLAELPLWGQLAAAITAAASAAYHDLFAFLAFIAIGATIYDYHLGRWTALHVTKDYDELRARIGQVSKFSGFVLVLIVRLLEAALTRGGIDGTDGMIAVALLVGLIIKDADSIEKHRIAGGARPIPFLSAALRRFAALEHKLLPAVPDTAPSPPQQEGL